jgi:cytochrome c oxidase subunit 3
MAPLVTTRTSPGRSRLAVRFILTAAGVYAAALGLAGLLIRLLPVSDAPTEAMLPPALWITTGLLIAGSAALQRAAQLVRREKQVPFRRSLVTALVLGTLFVGIQTYALRCLALHQIPAEVQTGSNAFLTVFAVLHAIHFTLALLFLVWVTLSALADRYDHEYSWGVTLCSLFWHALGVAWGVILGAFLIAAR